MRKIFKKMLATVLTVATCAISITAITTNAVFIYNSDRLTVDTVSFTANGVKYGLWQEMNDYFDSEHLKFFISEDGTRNILLENSHIVGWGFYGYEFENEEDAVALTEYLSANDIPYTEENCPQYTHINLTGDYTKDEHFQLIQKIKEDTGFIQLLVIPDDFRIMKVTDVENTLPAPTLLGDANEDGEVSLADAVFIMQVLSNPDDFQLTPQGMANADTDGDGVTVMDAFRIQEMMIE